MTGKQKNINPEGLSSPSSNDVQKNKRQSANDSVIYEFLPAAIEVEATPANRAGQNIIWAIVLLFVIAIAWAILGRMDIVAVAQGKIIPSDYTKQIQAFETARIAQIHVQEGERVTKGQLLVSLDPSQAIADETRLEQEITALEQANLRLTLLDEKISGTPKISNNKSSENTVAMLPISQQLLLEQEWVEYRSKVAALTSESKRLLAEMQMITAEISKKERVIPVIKERVDALDTLQKKSYGSKLQYLELKQELIEQEQDLDVQRARQQQLQHSVDAVDVQRQALISEQRKRNLTDIQANQTQLASLEQERLKAQTRAHYHSLLSPIDGQVQQLSIHTLGGVVTPAQVLMAIVPDNAELEVEVMIQNKDIGFVQEGQAVAVKVDTFNFTKYGLIPSLLKTISDDAIQDEELGLVYSARVALSQDFLSVDGRDVKLSPGMSVTAEVKTGTRRIIEFFLAPLLRYQQESLGER